MPVYVSSSFLERVKVGLFSFHQPIDFTGELTASNITYQRCMMDLKQFGYIRYFPSYNPFLGSLVYLLEAALEAKKQSNGSLYIR